MRKLVANVISTGMASFCWVYGISIRINLYGLKGKEINVWGGWGIFDPNKEKLDNLL